MNLVRGRKGNGRRGKKTMERGKGKGSRIMAYLSSMKPLWIGTVGLARKS